MCVHSCFPFSPRAVSPRIATVSLLSSRRLDFNRRRLRCTRSWKFVSLNYRFVSRDNRREQSRLRLDRVHFTPTSFYYAPYDTRVASKSREVSTARLPPARRRQRLGRRCRRNCARVYRPRAGIMELDCPG